MVRGVAISADNMVERAEVPEPIGMYQQLDTEPETLYHGNTSKHSGKRLVEFLPRITRLFSLLFPT
jgi:hypothetical protein